MSVIVTSVNINNNKELLREALLQEIVQSYNKHSITQTMVTNYNHSN